MSVYFIGSLINSAIPFLLLPLFTEHLSVRDFGQLSLFQTFAAFVMPLVIVGIQVFINTKYFALTDPKDFRDCVSSALVIPPVCTLLLLLVVSLMHGTFGRFTGLPLVWMQACVVLSLLQVVPTVVLFLLQASQMPVSYGAFQVSLTVLNFGLSVVLIANLGMDWRGRVYGLLGTNLAFTGVGLAWLARKGYLVPRFRMPFATEAFRFGFPIIPHEIGGLLIQMANRVLINVYAGLSVLGLYTVAFQVGSITSFFAMAFNQAWVPHLFSTLSDCDDAKRRQLVKISYLVMAGFMVLAFAMGLGARILFWIFVNPKFASAQPLVFWVALGFAFQGMYFVVVNYIIYEKKTYLLAYITASCGALNIGLTYLAIHRWGLAGVVRAQALANLVFFISTWIFSARVHPMPWLAVLRPKKAA
jgi:O-antigen/teichoic acid export membrane protein